MIDLAPADSNAYIFNPQSARASFIPDAVGLYLLRVFVSDSLLVDQAYVVVRAVGQAVVPPTADAGRGFATPTGDLVTLNGSSSSDAGGLALTYSWQLESAPVGSRTVLQNPSRETPSFTPDVDGEYRVLLQVSNGSLTSKPALIVIAAQQRPVANIAANPFILGTGRMIALSGEDSSGPAGEDLSYQWSLAAKPSGSTAALLNPIDVATTFVADIVGTYKVSLIASSRHLSSKVVQKSITVMDREQRVVAGKTITFQGSLAKSLGLSWDIVSRPLGSNAYIVSEPDLRASFKTDVPGSYIIRWNFVGREARLEDYSLVHAYLPQGSIVFGPKSYGSSRAICLRSDFLRGCSDSAWSFAISDLSKDYALIVEYSDVDAGFVYFNNQELAGRYDFSHERSSFAVEIVDLASNELRATFLGSPTVRFKVQEMALSGTEHSPPALVVPAIAVGKGKSATGQVTVTDAGSSRHTYSVLRGATYGTAEIDASGEISYMADATYEGRDSLIIRVENHNGLAQIIVAIIEVSDG